MVETQELGYWETFCQLAQENNLSVNIARAVIDYPPYFVTNTSLMKKERTLAYYYTTLLNSLSR